jgi:hypothetical protein
MIPGKDNIIRVLMVALTLCTRYAILLAVLASCRQKEEPPLEDYSHIDPATLTKGDTIKPFRFLHPAVADWKVEIRISGDDLHDVSRKITSRKFTATDEKLLNRFRKLRFLYGVGRPHKPSSTLRVFDDIHLYEQHGIVFEKKYLAFQSKRYGIMTCIDEEEFFKLLEEMY